MNKKSLNRLLGSIGLLLLVMSCQRDDICPETTQTTPMLVLRFYDAEDRDSPKTPTNLSIRATVAGKDTALYKTINRDSFAIPLRTDRNLTTYAFTLFDNADEEEEDPDLIAKTDSLSFTYGREQIYINRACAYKVIYNSMKLTLSGGEDGSWIDSYIIEEPNIEDETQAHISIFF
ncbi:hypothetical protein SAMN05444483_101748 [Salegentibacter echinorum]|uniref:Lipoprotein n=1 Tax=Salegentibacter echinorum TaxID=1073325 RepID=A0A1M5D0V7_SALEC|nr:DUF6452 family protein [Salegentibacter echinorum]SHF60465.1 hypothetical protein SAMN05444483_101748 [Salegentibacter echinorum]